MRFIYLLAAGLASANAYSVKRDRTPRDLVTLRVIGGLQNLPIALARGGLANYTTEAFAEAGFDADVRPNIEKAVEGMEDILSFISETIVAGGQTPFPPETYDFPFDSPRAFVYFLATVQRVGASAFVEVTNSLRDRGLRTWAISATATIVRQSAYFRSIAGLPPYTASLESSLPLNVVLTGTRNFVTSPTPPEYAELGFEELPLLFTDCNALAESTGEIIYISDVIEKAEAEGTELFAVVRDGLEDIIVPVTINNGTARLDRLPEGVAESVYVGLTDRNEGRERGRFVSEVATVEVAEDGAISTGQCVNVGQAE